MNEKENPNWLCAGCNIILLMPSIPGIQQKIVKDVVLSEISDNLDLKKIKEFQELMKIKHPILHGLVTAHIMFRIYRAGILLSIHLKLNQKGIIAEIANYRFQILAYNTILYLLTWNILSDKLGWNWDFNLDV